MLAREIRTLAGSLSTDGAGTGVATSADEIVALDSLDGASFSPPIRADRTVMTELDGWTQQIDVALYDMNDATGTSVAKSSTGLASAAAKVQDDSTGISSGRVAVSESVVGRLPVGSTHLYLLTVTILDQGETVASHEWWLRP